MNGSPQVDSLSRRDTTIRGEGSGLRPNGEACDIGHSRLLEMVRLRVTQLLGCTEGIETHARHLLHLGESMGKIGQVYWWHESRLFDEREQAALNLCEALTVNDDRAVLEAILDEVAKHLTREEIVGVVLSVGTVLDWSNEGKSKAA
jgi:alkylhydroperoxidase family enzyme